jgi:four helix bundle protein
VSERINSFQDLRVYYEACALDLAIFKATKSFPREEMFSLTDQVRRSSRSVGANISEAWAKRRYPAHFVSKLTCADGELQETRHWTGRACAYDYIDQAALDDLNIKCAAIGRMLGKMMQSPEDFT